MSLATPLPDPAPPATQRLRMLIAYDGAPFRGWQSQSTRDAVQDHIETAFAKLVGKRCVVSGAGRTDAGVHALGQVAHADVPKGRMTIAQWQPALNAHLPSGVRILKITKASTSFHARFSATGKVYTYRAWNASFIHPLEIGRVWHIPGRLDLELLRALAGKFEGSHDFASFAANRGTPVASTVRTIHGIHVQRRGHLLTLRFQGNGFLYRMVRLLTGSLLRCARGKADPAWLEQLLAQPGREKTKYCAPPEGLYLTRVLYGRATADSDEDDE